VRTRPWRAVASIVLPNGGRLVVARTSRVTRAALTPWLETQRGYGYATDWWMQEPIPAVAEHVQAAPSPGR
jgi:hypothetical protein